jgi:hypothetical protein
MLNDVLGVAIGVLFVYLLLSLTCSGLAEWISRLRGFRAEILQEWIRRLLSEDESGVEKVRGVGKDDPGGTRDLTGAIYQHPFIRAVFPEKKGQRPACIPPRNFALALVDTLAPASPENDVRDLKYMRDGIKASPLCNDKTRNVLLLLIDEAQGKLEKAIKNIEGWFDDPQGTSKNWYRQRINSWVLVLAGLICAGLNLDTIMIADTLWKRPALRESVAASAASLTGQLEPSESGKITAKMETLMLALEKSKIPVGWCRDCQDPRRRPEGFYGWLLKVVGIGATILSAIVGAPFWFDLLRKILGLRAAVRSRSDGSEGAAEQGGGGGPSG